MIKQRSSNISKSNNMSFTGEIEEDLVTLKFDGNIEIYFTLQTLYYNSEPTTGPNTITITGDNGADNEITIKTENDTFHISMSADIGSMVVIVNSNPQQIQDYCIFMRDAMQAAIAREYEEEEDD